MRRHLVAKLITLALWVAVPGLARAQATAQNTVTVHIPTVVRLRIGPSTATTSRAVDFTIDGAAVTPDHLAIDVFANSAWTLTVQETAGNGPELEYDVAGDGSWRTPSQQPQVDAGSGPTGGWQAIALDFRVASPAPAGSHRQTLTFTLARP